MRGKRTDHGIPKRYRELASSGCRSDWNVTAGGFLQQFPAVSSCPQVSRKLLRVSFELFVDTINGVDRMTDEQQLHPAQQRGSPRRASMHNPPPRVALSCASHPSPPPQCVGHTCEWHLAGASGAPARSARWCRGARRTAQTPHLSCSRMYKLGNTGCTCWRRRLGRSLGRVRSLLLPGTDGRRFTAYLPG
jgi:hypothetical protein